MNIETKQKNRTHAVQHKCLPLLACIHPTPQGNILKNCNYFEISKKIFPYFVELVETNTLIYIIYKTLYFDQYSRLAIRLNIFWFSAKNSETYLKF